MDVDFLSFFCWMMPASLFTVPLGIPFDTPTAQLDQRVFLLVGMRRKSCQIQCVVTWMCCWVAVDKALGLAREIKHAAPDQPVILTVHEMKRLARNAAELMALAAELETNGIQLELFTGPLAGIYDPNGMGAMLFTVLAVAAQLDRTYIREKTLEGQQAAAARGNHGGRPKVIDPDSLIFARALKETGIPIPQIAAKLTIKTGKNAGRHPSVASLYRALAETPNTDEATSPPSDDDLDD